MLEFNYSNERKPVICPFCKWEMTICETYSVFFSCYNHKQVCVEFSKNGWFLYDAIGRNTKEIIGAKNFRIINICSLNEMRVFWCSDISTNFQ